MGTHHLTPMAVDEQPLPLHLVVVHHGYGAGPHTHAEFCDQIMARHPTTLVLNSAVNSADGKIQDGVMACGERLAGEIKQMVAENPSLHSISMVGVSMGGLISRAAAGILWGDRRIAGLVPEMLCCMASPMLGVRKTLPWFGKAAVWLFGRFERFQSRSMSDLMLEPDDDSSCTLEQLTTGPYISALQGFKRRVVAGATHGDALCPYATAMLAPHSPNMEPSTLEADTTRMVAGHVDPAGYIPELECDVEQHFGEDSLEYKLLCNLRRLSWERYELFVSSQDRVRFLGAHNDRALQEAHELLLNTVRVGSHNHQGD